MWTHILLGWILMKYTIVNMVAAASLDQNLDLYSLAVGIPNIEYEPEQFPGAILKIKEPKVSLLLFKNGKIICSGASSEAQIQQGPEKQTKWFTKSKEMKVKRNVMEIVNFVATAFTLMLIWFVWSCNGTWQC